MSGILKKVPFISQVSIMSATTRWMASTISPSSTMATPQERPRRSVLKWKMSIQIVLILKGSRICLIQASPSTSRRPAAPSTILAIRALSWGGAGAPIQATAPASSASSIAMEKRSSASIATIPTPCLSIPPTVASNVRNHFKQPLSIQCQGAVSIFSPLVWSEQTPLLRFLSPNCDTKVRKILLETKLFPHLFPKSFKC